MQTPSRDASKLPGMSDYAGWTFGPVGRSRDSDALERSNWDVVTQELLALAKNLPDGRQTVEVHRFGHWAVGWVEEIVVCPDDPDALALQASWERNLERYPVADEMHYSDTEYQEHQGFWDHCGMRERVRLCADAGLSIFASRRPDVPCRDSGQYVTA